jgi:hypothetical protein
LGGRGRFAASWSSDCWAGSGSASASDPTCEAEEVEEEVLVVEKGRRGDERTRRERRRRTRREAEVAAMAATPRSEMRRRIAGGAVRPLLSPNLRGPVGRRE